MAKKQTKKQKKSWWKVVLCGIMGSALVVLPLLMLISLLGYDAADPSFNKVTDGEVHNFLGVFGSYSADIIFSTFGLSLMVFLLVPIFWGVSLIRFQAFAEYKARIFAWIVGILSFACFIDLTCHSYLGDLGWPNLTGDWSRSLSRPLNTYINMLKVPYNTLILEGIILFVSILAFNLAAGITFKRWINLARGLWGAVKWCGQLFVSAFKKVARIREYKEFKELNPRYLQSKMQDLSKPKLRIRREPAFSSAASVTADESVSASFETASSPQIIIGNSGMSAVTAHNGPMIEMPASGKPTVGNLAIKEEADTQTYKKNSFNPTFDFVAEGDIANQNVKKPSKKISPQDIYQTEGVKAFSTVKPAIKKTEDKADEEDLLTVPQTAEQTHLSHNVQSQIPSGREQSSQMQKESAKISAKEQNNQTSGATQKPVAKTYADYVLPDINLLTIPQNDVVAEYDEESLKANAAKLETVLNDFGIHGKIVKVRPGPVVTLYELEPAPGTRTARVIGLSDDIARSMAVASVRMAVVSGSNTIGIELPNAKRETVWLRELFEDDEFKKSKNILNVALGKDIGGQHIYADLSKMPHLLVAGTTGSGKSVGVNSMILSLLYRMKPEQCKFIMIDPKQLEFSMYNGIPHLLTPVITDPTKAVVGLKWAVREMEDRYRAMSLLNVRNIAGYNQKVADMQKSGKEMKKTIQTGFDKETGRPIYEEQVIDTSPMPYIVIVVDEMADLMLVAGKEVEAAIQRLAQMARAAGIHLIMSTQRPSVDVITGTIKSNFPSRISFHVTTKIDSRTILGEQGAEQLLGMGDMLYMPSGLRPVRVHGCYVKDEEVEKIVEFVKSQGEPQYVTDVTEGELNTKDSGAVFDKGEMAGAGGGSDDELYRQAVEIVRNDKKASTSYIQRKLRLGYNRAAMLIERMEDEGIVTPPDRVGRRTVIGVE